MAERDFGSAIYSDKCSVYSTPVGRSKQSFYFDKCSKLALCSRAPAGPFASLDNPEAALYSY